MKINKTILSTISILLITLAISCKKETNIDETCIFNTNDPIHDLTWLNNKITKTPSSDTSVQYYLYQNKSNTKLYYFEEVVINNIVLNYTHSVIYNCKGDTIMMKAIEGPPPTGWSKFFEDNIAVRQIWPVK